MTRLSDRHDLSDWLIHFVHRRREPVPPGTSVQDALFGRPLAYHEDGKLLQPSPFMSIMARLGNMFPAESFGVLEKILDDGFLLPTWSLRDGKATVYGPHTAVCFTEMPLYALLDYVQKRADQDFVDGYGLAVRKAKLFARGARPVIYGITTSHKEAGDSTCRTNYRRLAPSCGIGVAEQFRYVRTALDGRYGGGSGIIDWTHEREWRWPFRGQMPVLQFGQDIEGRPAREGVPGLPIWLDMHPPWFRDVLLFSQTSAEAESLLDRLQLLIDLPDGQFRFPRNVDTLKNTFVFATEKLSGAPVFGDAFVASCRSPRPAVPTAETVNVIERSFGRVQAGAPAVLRESQSQPEYRPDVWHLGYVTTTAARTAVTRALLQGGHLKVNASRGYCLQNILPSMEETVAGVPCMDRKVAEFVAKELSALVEQAFVAFPFLEPVDV
jgi:hypothetical protein